MSNRHATPAPAIRQQIAGMFLLRLYSYNQPDIPVYQGNVKFTTFEKIAHGVSKIT
jgi:hypothetical protein